MHAVLSSAQLRISQILHPKHVLDLADLWHSPSAIGGLYLLDGWYGTSILVASEVVLPHTIQ